MSIALEQIAKHFGRQVIVDRVSLEVREGELFVLLGASGSGKSTILRITAGLLAPDHGRVLLHGRDVTGLPPQKRDVGFVFQNYTVFRHMTVAENIEFGLKVRRVPAAERRRRHEQLLDLVGLAGLGKRFPGQLSGGQLQRVAIARALAYEPKVLLLDEPFGALDVKIRTQLRRSLKEIQRKLGVTAILVTHDQEEAFELADRIGVLERGRLLEVGTAETLYAQPKSLSVATFLGGGAVLTGRAEGGTACFGDICLPLPAGIPHYEGDRIQVLIRPEQVVLSEQRTEGSMPAIGRGLITEQSFTGALRRVRVRLAHLAATRQIAPPLPFGEEGLLLDAVLPADSAPLGREVWVQLRGWHVLTPPAPRLMVLETDSGLRAPLRLVRLLVDRLSASATLVAFVETKEAASALRKTLKTRLREAGLSDVEVRFQYHDSASQTIREADPSHEMVILAPGSRRLKVRDPRTHGLDPLTLRILQESEVPVLLVKGETESLSRVLICTAAGEHGKTDVQVGGRLARRLGAAVTLLYVARRAAEAGPVARAHLERAAATLRSIDVASEVRVRESDSPAAGILAEAREGNHDLVVLGVHDPGSRSFFKIHDVTLQVIAAADRPLLVVPSRDA